MPCGRCDERRRISDGSDRGCLATFGEHWPRPDWATICIDSPACSRLLLSLPFHIHEKIASANALYDLVVTKSILVSRNRCQSYSKFKAHVSEDAFESCDLEDE